MSYVDEYRKMAKPMNKREYLMLDATRKAETIELVEEMCNIWGEDPARVVAVTVSAADGMTFEHVPGCDCGCPSE